MSVRPVMNAGQFKEQFMVERYAERVALKQVRGESFTHCMKLNHHDVDLMVTGKNGEEVVIHGKDIANKKCWTKFLDDMTPPLELGWISYEAGKVATRYAQWLRTKYTERYRFISSNSEMEWLRKTALLATLWHMMEHKHETHSFLDEWAESEMGKQILARLFCRDMARAVNHGIKDREHAADLLEQAYEKFLGLIEDRKFASYEALAGLPAGTPDPLALPEEEEVTDE